MNGVFCRSVEKLSV